MKKINESVYRLVNSLDDIRSSNDLDRLGKILAGLGLSADTMIDLNEFVTGVINTEDYEAFKQQQSFIDYTDSLDYLVAQMEWGKAYEEMGAINLAIAEESFHLEEEGANLGYGKVDTAQTENESKEA